MLGEFLKFKGTYLFRASNRFWKILEGYYFIQQCDAVHFIYYICQMTFEDVIGQQSIKTHLMQNIESGRRPHAIAFSGLDGYGTLQIAISYAEYLMRFDANSNSFIDPLNHPDIHYFFPVVKKGSSSNSSLSKDYMSEFKSFVNKHPYGDLTDWLDFIEAGNKQGVITVDEAQVILKTLALKSFSGQSKVLIIWHAEKMTNSCANKLLKWIEEPNPKTTILLITEQHDMLLKTIQSRCQIITTKPIPPEDISEVIIKQGVEAAHANKIAKSSEGNLQTALNFLTNNENDLLYEQLFIEWVRTAFQAKSKKNAINTLMNWSDKVSKLGRESVKQFLAYSSEAFRQALLLNYGVSNFVHLKIHEESFSLQKFSKFIGGHNIEDICSEIQKSIFHIERNANGKIVLIDLSIKLTRLLHLPQNN